MALEIEEWEIWHTYATYLESTGIDLQESARRLVASGVAECVMSRDGRTYWRSNSTVETGWTFVETDSISGDLHFDWNWIKAAKRNPQALHQRLGVKLLIF